MYKRQQIDRTGPIFEEAERKAAIEFGVDGVSGSLIGMPAKSYAEGEFLQRSLKDDFDAAYAAYESGEDVTALTEFFEDNPEYSTRLALWKEPEERMRKFLNDELWNRYHNLPKVHKDQIREFLGPEYETLWLNKDTSSPDSIPMETLGTWLKLMGGDPPGSLNSPAPALELAPPEVAYSAQVFYDNRIKMFPDYYKQQNEYFKLKEKSAARKQYMRDNPELGDYWDWRKDFFHRNPDTVQYLTDDYQFEYKSIEDVREAEAKQPTFSAEEWKQMMGPSATNLVLDNLMLGEELSPATIDKLKQFGDRFGMSYRDVLNEVAEAWKITQ